MTNKTEHQKNGAKCTLQAFVKMKVNSS